MSWGVDPYHETGTFGKQSNVLVLLCVTALFSDAARLNYI